MKKGQYLKVKWVATVAATVATVLLICCARAIALESVTLPIEVIREDVVSVELPTISEGEISVFDFILDPQKLLYIAETSQIDGRTVEEGATLLFENKEGQYDFSRYSDMLTVTNRGTVSVRLTISAWVTDLGEIQIVGSDDFADSTDCSIYLAIVDSQGNLLPISADGEISISLEMHAAPENAYVYRLSEDLQTYRLELLEDLNGISFDTYSFGLVGACNANADWKNISTHPAITVAWRVEPMGTEQEESPVEEESIFQSEDEDYTEGDSTFDEDGQQSEDDDEEQSEDEDGRQSEDDDEQQSEDDDEQQLDDEENASEDVEMEDTVSGN